MINNVIYSFRQSQPAFGIKGKKRFSNNVRFSTLYPDGAKKIVAALKGEAAIPGKKLFIPAIDKITISKDQTKVRLKPKVPTSRDLLVKAVKKVAERLEIKLH